MFIIKDWADNDLTSYYGKFKTFEDAWAALYERFSYLSEEDFNRQMEEFYVVKIESVYV